MYSNRRPAHFMCQSKAAQALVIVLLFVVLITILVVALLTMALSNQEIAVNSANQTKVEIFAQGAGQQIIGDLKEEIAAGSVVTPLASPSGSVYTPTVFGNAVPCRIGTSNTLPNLIKTSRYNSPFYSNNASGITQTYNTTTYSPPNRASNLPTDTSVSLNGRVVSAARWNAPLLMQPSTSGVDYTPQNTLGFKAPDWILMGRDGSNPMTVVSSQTAANYVIGRYAYAIYDEGGLLDLNVAGAPSTSSNYLSPTSLTANTLPPSVTSPVTASELAYKPSLAFADLTQVGFTTAQSDVLVGWRNYATTQAPNPFPNAPGFTTTCASNFLTNMLTNTTGFLTTSTPALYHNQSDQAFTGRQQLLSFLQNGLGLSPYSSPVFQYVSAFSRDLNQPSFTPMSLPPTVLRPTIVSGLGTITSPNYYDDYGGGNNGYGSDNAINPPFLTVRVNCAFTRCNGNMAVPGEPLVKKRFPLEYLAWLTCKGPSASRNYSDADMAALLTYPGVTTALLKLGTPQNIGNYFGLVWDSTNHLWDYAPGYYAPSSTPAAAPLAGTITLMGKITGREPNFFELLKATIIAGSLGKSVGGGVVGTTFQNLDGLEYQFLKDSVIDNQIMQIGINIIEQAATDAYPKRISFDNGTNGPRIFVGVENLPYIYRWKNLAVLAAAGDPQPSSTIPQTLKFPGVGVGLIVPEMWNPHDPNSSLGVTSFRPGAGQLRVVVDNIVDIAGPNGNVPLGTDIGGPGGAANVEELNDAGSGGGVHSIATPGFQLNPNTSALVYGDNNGQLFREPTALRTPGVPSGSGLSLASTHQLFVMKATLLSESGSSLVGADGSLKDYRDPNDSFIGFYTGYYPLEMTTGPTPIYAYDGVYGTEGGVTGFYEWNNIFHNQTELTFRAQCQDAYGNWIDYDNKMWTSTAASNFRYRSADYTDGTNVTDAASLALLLGNMGYGYSFDPRTSRFGVNCSYNGQGGILPYILPFLPSVTSPGAASTSTSAVYNTWVKTPMCNQLGTTRYGFNAYNNGNQYNWFRHSLQSGFQNITDPSGAVSYGNGLLADAVMAQNNPNARYYLGEVGYYPDPDGVVRRAMGAYSPPGYSAGTTAVSSNLGIPTVSVDYPIGTINSYSQNRPLILHRPFRSVAELGYVCRDEPWKNLDFFTPESGDGGLLDVFCIHDSSNNDALMAGKVNLNTRQQAVLQAVLSGAYKDEAQMFGLQPMASAYGATSSSGIECYLQPNEVTQMAQALVNRTSGATTVTSPNPLSNLADLIGQYQGSNNFYGFTRDLTGLFAAAAGNSTGTGLNANYVQRLRESPIRPLANCSQTRVWNLLIDVIAQTGQYPFTATTASNFLVRGEKRYWIHVALDRMTNQVIDMQVESVNE